MATLIRREGKNGSVTWQVKIRRKSESALTATFDKKIDAEKWALGTESDIQRGRYIDLKEASQTTLLEALDRYLIEISPQKKGHKQEIHRINLWKNCSFSNKSLAQIKNSDIAKWRDERQQTGIAANTIKNDLILLSHIFSVASRDWGMALLANPVQQVRKPKLPQGREVRLNRDEETELLKCIDHNNAPWLKPIIIMAIETAMRLSEILALKKSLTDIPSQITKLLDTKNGTARTVPLSRRAVTALKEAMAMAEGDRIFEVPVPTLEKHFQKARARAKLPNLHFHDLRHEATSRLFERGLDIMQVASITGHKSLQMLKRYTHLRAEDLAKKLD